MHLKACQELDDEDAKIRNLACLMQEVPWWNKTLLLKILPLLYHATLPKYADKSGLTLTVISILSTPFLLRSTSIPIIAGSGRSVEDTDRNLMTSAAAGCHIVSFIIQNQGKILNSMRQDLIQIQNKLNTKVSRIQALHSTITKAFTMDMSDLSSALSSDCLNDAAALWNALEMTEKERMTVPKSNPSSGENSPEKSFEDEKNEPKNDWKDPVALFSHSRWEVCGFPKLTSSIRSRAISIESQFRQLDEENTRYFSNF